MSIDTSLYMQMERKRHRHQHIQAIVNIFLKQIVDSNVDAL